MIYLRQPHLPLSHVRLFYPRTLSSIDTTTSPAQRSLAQRQILRGTQRATRAEFMREVEQLGAEISLNDQPMVQSLNAITLTRTLPQLLLLLSECLREPRFDHVEFAQSQRALCAELSSRYDDDSELAWLWFSRRLYSTHALWDELAVTEERIREVSLDQLRYLWPEIYSSSSVLPCLTSNIDEDEMRGMMVASGLISTLDLSAESFTARSLSWPELDPLRRTTLTLVHKAGRSQAQILIGHPVPAPNDPRYLKLSLAICAMGGMFSSPLMQEVRVKRGLSYDAHAAIRGEGATRFITLSASPDVNDCLKTLDVMLNVFTETIEGALSDEELERAKSYLINVHPFSIETPMMRASLIANAHLQGLDPSEALDTPRRLAKITPEEARSVARELLNPHALEVLILTDQEELQSQVDAIKARLKAQVILSIDGRDQPEAALT